jgi:BirA family biotin operon repressor/biotin-[acetyl-CoA-carboxylase] ligase
VTFPPDAAPLGVPLVRLAVTESTNDVARLLASAGAREGAVVVAGRQTKGRGRLGRVWLSPEGGLWCSIVLRPIGRTPAGLLSLAAGVAACEAIEMASGVRAGLKWPNDVVLGDRKVGGILIEGAADATIAGFGINVRVPMEDLPPDAAEMATSLHLAAGRPMDREAVLEPLLERFARWYQVWLDGGTGIVEAWSLRDVTLGRPVRISMSGETLEGTADGVEPDGALRVREASGRTRRVVAGDLVPGQDVTRAR